MIYLISVVLFRHFVFTSRRRRRHKNKLVSSLRTVQFAYFRFVFDVDDCFAVYLPARHFKPFFPASSPLATLLFPTQEIYHIFYSSMAHPRYCNKYHDPTSQTISKIPRTTPILIRNHAEILEVNSPNCMLKRSLTLELPTKAYYLGTRLPQT